MNPVRIMIVEDEAIVALDIRNRLQFLGYEVCGVTTTGEDATELARRLKPNLILMDIMLEGEMDGIDAAAQIRRETGAPVIYLTAYADEDTLQRAKVTEPFGYVMKPFEDRELHTTIEMALYKHKTERRLVANERFLATTLRSIGEAVITTDKGGAVRFINPVAERMLGLRAEDAIGRELGSLFHIVEEDTGRCVIHPARSFLTGEIATPGASHLLVTGNNGRVPVADTFSPIRDDQGLVLGTVLVFRDITERRRSEKALEKTLSELRRTLLETVNALAATSEKRDPYTAGHQQRVARLACVIARDMGLAGEMIEGVRVAGVLHDLGKINVPAEILAKPARLTSMEMGIMKAHSEVGYDILKSIPFPWPVADIVLQHHERIDGSGYPLGLSGDDIRLESRILSVADVVEAMSSHRPYRAALGLENALAEIETHRGSLYDAESVDCCLALFREKGYVLEERESL